MFNLPSIARKALAISAFCLIPLMGMHGMASAQQSANQNTNPSQNVESGRIDITEENDYFASHDDRHYTQGALISYLTSPVEPTEGWNKPYEWLGDGLPIFSGSDRKRKYDWSIVGQSIFTPANLNRVGLVAKDRPYAAWLYTGASLLQETNDSAYTTLENFEILGGVVGPAALGGVTQNNFHQFIGDTAALGWQHQINTEIGAIVTYERKWRFEQPLIGNLGIDAIPEVGGSGGNILTYGETGGMVRFGQNLGADYGANHIRPSLSGTNWFNPSKLDGDLGWYVFAGTQGRAVARNIFLDGNTFESSPSVDKKTLVADFVGGASLFWSSAARIDFSVTQRTKEFYEQRGHPDRFGTINLTFGL